MLMLLEIEQVDFTPDKVVPTMFLSATTWRAVQNFANIVMLAKKNAKHQRRGIVETFTHSRQKHTILGIEDEENTHSESYISTSKR